MKPITRKELYLNKIVGNNEYETPEKPISEEEFFFAEILGEAVQAPEPLTRYQMFLAKIAGRNIEIPMPITRLEHFLARAAGMEIETPTPITREEIYWSNYTAIVEFEVENAPPLTYKAIEGMLKNYRIYGNTVDGESVGDRTANLFANLWKKGYIRADNGREEQIDGFICSGFFPVEYGQTYSISRNINVGYDNVRGYRDDGSFIGAGTDICDVSNPFPSSATNIGVFTVTNENVAFIRFNDSVNDLDMKYMIVDGTYTEQTMPSYEPYGYRVPVTVTNGTDTETTNFYLPEQIKMVGDEAEYIDYGEQKQHRVRKNLLKNTATSQTINGLTYTVNTDGSVTCNGRREQTSQFFKIGSVTTSGEIILSGCPSGGSSASFAMRAFSATASNPRDYYDIGDGCMLNIPDTYNIYIRIQSDYTCDNLTFYPMIRKAAIEDDTYEPYIENTDLDVTLPALPTLSGTNTLSVGRAVQPSKVYVKGQKERE